MAHAARSIDPPPMMDINVTPLIDVMLVMLIMFIITIPMQTHAVKLDLPSGPPLHANPIKNEVRITRTDAILWNEQPVDQRTLRVELRFTQRMRTIPELHLRPDSDARYETVDQVLGLIKLEHVQKVGFVGNEAYAVR